MTAQAQIRDLTFAEYRAAPGINHSWLSKMDISPLAFKTNAGPELADDALDAIMLALKPDTKALNMGRLLHLCTLEHELFLETAVIWPGGFTRPSSGEPKPTNSKSSADYKEFKVEQEALGNVVVNQKDIDLCELIAGGIRRHPFASMLLTNSKNEVSIEWTHRYGVPCKGRIDALTSKAIGDLKFLRDIRPHKVERAILDYNYHSQAAFYSDAVFALTGERRPYFIIAAEKTEPLDVVVYEIDDAALDLGRQKYERWLRSYLQCSESGIWPGISDRPIKVELPNWAYEDEITKGISMEGMEVEG